MVSLCFSLLAFSSSAGLLVCVLSQGVLGAMRLTVSATQLGLFADSRLAWPHVTLCCDSKSSVTVWLWLGGAER